MKFSLPGKFRSLIVTFPGQLSCLRMKHNHERIQRGQGVLTTPLKNPGFLSNTGPDPLKITKLPSQHSMLGHYRHASATAFNGCHWRINDDPLIVVFGSSLPSSAKNKQKKTKLSGSNHDTNDKTLIILVVQPHSTGLSQGRFKTSKFYLMK